MGVFLLFDHGIFKGAEIIGTSTFTDFSGRVLFLASGDAPPKKGLLFWSIGCKMKVYVAWNVQRDFPL